MRWHGNPAKYRGAELVETVCRENLRLITIVKYDKS
jgi:hypothetical protein